MRILSFCKNTVCGKIDLIKNVDYNILAHFDDDVKARVIDNAVLNIN